MKNKIIHILAHSPSNGRGPAYESGPKDENPTLGSTNPGDYEHYQRIEHYPYWIGFFQNDWHVKVARETLKVTDEYEVECWRPYLGIDKIHSKDVNGIIHRLFPSRRIRIGRYNLGERSPLIVNEIKKVIKNSKVILHLHGTHSTNINYILRKVNLKRIPVVAQHHGGSSYHHQYKIKKNPLLLLLHLVLKEKRLLKQVDSFFALNRLEKNDLEELGCKNVKIQTMGVNFDFFRPINKKSCRDELGLPLDKKVILFIGRFNKEKGFYFLMKAAMKLLKTRDDFIVVNVGGLKNKDNAKYWNNKNIMMFNRVSKNELLNFYNASDTLVLPSLNEGFGLVIIEAMACNTPVIASSVGGILDIKEKINTLKLVSPQNVDEMIVAIKEYLRKPPLVKSREKAIHFYSWQKIIKDTIKIYRILEEKYEFRN